MAVWWGPSMKEPLGRWREARYLSAESMVWSIRGADCGGAASGRACRSVARSRGGSERNFDDGFGSIDCCVLESAPPPDWAAGLSPGGCWSWCSSVALAAEPPPPRAFGEG